MKKIISIGFSAFLTIACLHMVAACSWFKPNISGTYYYYDNAGFDKNCYVIVKGANWEDQDKNSGTVKLEQHDGRKFDHWYSATFYLSDTDSIAYYCSEIVDEGYLYFEKKSTTLNHGHYCKENYDTSEIPLPRRITNKEEFYNIYTYSGGTYDIMNDIDLEGDSLFQGSTSAKSFRLTLNGRGHTVKNFKINSSTTTGLFPSLENSEIKNLKIAEAKMYGENTGALAGSVVNSTITNITVENSVSIGDGSHIFSGGVVGFANNSSLTSCVSYANVKGQSNSGGIVGKAYNSNIVDCVNYGNVTTYGGVIGGIVGYYHQYWESYSNHSEKFANNKNYGTIDSHGNDKVGGCIGSIGRNKPGIRFTDDSSKLGIADCYNYGNVLGYNSVGGIVGNEAADDGINTIVDFTSCSNYGNVKGNMYVGGILGQGQSNIKFNNCTNEYNEAKDNSVSGCSIVGGIASMGNYFANCANNGSVEFYKSTNLEEQSYLGGITGCQYNTSKSSFIWCVNAGIVKGYQLENANQYGGQCVGGIAGQLSGGTFADCINNGEIYAKEYVGGLIGKLIPEYETSIMDCQINGKIVVADSGTAGGFIGSLNYSNVNADSSTKHYSAKFVLSNCKIDSEITLGNPFRFGYCVGVAYSTSTSDKQYGNALIRDCEITMKVFLGVSTQIKDVYQNSERNGVPVLKCELDNEKINVTTM